MASHIGGGGKLKRGGLFKIDFIWDSEVGGIEGHKQWTTFKSANLDIVFITLSILQTPGSVEVPVWYMVIRNVLFRLTEDK